MGRLTPAGITLIGMAGLLTILGLALGCSGTVCLVQKARVVATRAQIVGFTTALCAYKSDTGVFPANEQALQALRVRPEGLARWSGPYLPQDVPQDPWGHPYQYKYSGAHGDGPTIYSLGGDGLPDGEAGSVRCLSP